MKDAGLTLADIDGVATAGISPVDLAYYLGISPTFADGTLGRRLPVHAAARHGGGHHEGSATWCSSPTRSGRSQIDAGLSAHASSPRGNFKQPYRRGMLRRRLTIPALRYMKTYAPPRGSRQSRRCTAVMGEQEPAREFSRPRHGRGRPQFGDGRMPFRKLMCCLVTDGIGALNLTSARACGALSTFYVLYLEARLLIDQMGFTSIFMYRA